MKNFKAENIPTYDPKNDIDIQAWTEKATAIFNQYQATDEQIKTQLPSVFVKQSGNLYHWYSSNASKFTATTTWKDIKENLHQDKGMENFMALRSEKFHNLKAENSGKQSYTEYALEKESLRLQAFGTEFSDATLINLLIQELPRDAKKHFISKTFNSFTHYQNVANEYFSEFPEEDPVKPKRTHRQPYQRRPFNNNNHSNQYNNHNNQNTPNNTTTSTPSSHNNNTNNANVNNFNNYNNRNQPEKNERYANSRDDRNQNTNRNQNNSNYNNNRDRNPFPQNQNRQFYQNTNEPIDEEHGNEPSENEVEDDEEDFYNQC
ncbi:hypothetical protein BDR26DRAFT_857309 [Obelidium mucronatum]|nr:hypothetical protein BDR26DRAFT_857309 [Obelidium mucronatum]